MPTTFSNIVTVWYMVTKGVEHRNCEVKGHISLWFAWAQNICATPLARKTSIEETWVWWFFKSLVLLRPTFMKVNGRLDSNKINDCILMVIQKIEFSVFEEDTNFSIVFGPGRALVLLNKVWIMVWGEKKDNLLQAEKENIKIIWQRITKKE